MSNITNDELEKIANLSRIKLNQEEISYYQKEVSQIIDWTEKLKEVNTENVEPMIGVFDGLKMRSDEVVQESDMEEILSNAPERKMTFFSVPKFVE